MELSEDSCREQEWCFCRFGLSVVGRWAVARGSGSCTEVEMVAVVVVETVTVVVVVLAGTVAASFAETMAVSVDFGNCQTDSRIPIAFVFVVVPVTASALPA